MSALFEVFYQPGKLFASLPERKYAWVLPLIVVSLFGVFGYYLMNKYIGTESMARQSMQMYAGRLSPEQMQQAIAQSTSPGRVITGYIFGFIGTAVAMLVVSGALMSFAMMTSRAPKFGPMLSMVTLAYVPYYLVVMLMMWLTLALSPDPASMDFRNLLATNVGAFMNKNETAKGLYSLMTSMDILSFAEIGLLSLGFSKLTKSKMGVGLGAVLTLWAVYVLAKMGLSLVFG
jgi:hypothetical protein